MIMVRFSGLHPKLGASQNESAYGSVPDPFPSPLKMGKGRQRQTNLIIQELCGIRNVHFNYPKIIPI